MTNNQNWPDRVYLVNKFDLSVFDHRINPDDAEYISSEKVREIQLATVKATVKLCAEQFSVDQTLVGACIAAIDPYSIIEQVKI